MFAPPGVDSDDNDSSSEEITPPPSPKVRTRPSFSFKSLFSPTKRPSVKQQRVNEAEEIKSLTPVQAANFLPPTPPKGKKRVRIHLDGEEELQGKDPPELPTSLPYLAQHTEGNEERSQAADEVLTLLRQLVADQAVARKQGINPDHSKLSTIHPFPSPSPLQSTAPIPKEESADARTPRKPDEKGDKTDKNDKLTSDKAKQPTTRSARERPKGTNRMDSNKTDRMENIDPSDPNLPPEGHHLNESYYQSFIPFPEPRLIPQSASRTPQNMMDDGEPRMSSGPSQDGMRVPASRPPPQNRMPGPAWQTGPPDPLYPPTVRPPSLPYQGPQGPPHTYDSDYPYRPRQDFHPSYAPQQPSLPQPSTTSYQTSQQDWYRPPPISATGHDCQSGMPSSQEQRANSGYVGASNQYPQTLQYLPTQQYPHQPPYSAPPQGYLPQPPHPPPFYPHPAVLLPYNPYYSTHPLHMPQQLPQQPNYYPTNPQYQATLSPPIHSAPLQPTEQFSSPLANPWPGSSNNGSIPSPSHPIGLEADGLILRPSPATPLAARSHNVQGVGGSVKGSIGSRFSLSNRHGQDNPNVKSMSEFDDPVMGAREKSEKEAILQVHERRVWDHFLAKGLKGSELEEAVYKTLSEAASPKPEWRSEKEVMDSPRPTDGKPAPMKKPSKVSGTAVEKATGALGLQAGEPAETVQMQGASGPGTGTLSQPVVDEIENPTKSAREEKLRSHYARKGLTGERLDKAVAKAMAKEARSLRPETGRAVASGEALRPADEKVVHRTRQEDPDSKVTREELPPITLRGKKAVRNPKGGGAKEAATSTILRDPAPEAGPSILPKESRRIAGLVDEVAEQKEKLKMYYAKKGLKGEELERMVKKALDKSEKAKAKTTGTSKSSKDLTDVALQTIIKTDARETTDDPTARMSALDLQKEKMSEHHAAEGLSGFELGKAVAKSMANDAPKSSARGTEVVLNDVGSSSRQSKPKSIKKHHDTSEQEASYPKSGSSHPGPSDMEEAKLRARYASKGYTPGQIDRILSKLSRPSSGTSSRPQGENVDDPGQAENTVTGDARKHKGRNKGKIHDKMGKHKEAELREAVGKLSIPGSSKGDPKENRDLKGKGKGRPREDGESSSRGNSEGSRLAEIVDEGIMLEVEKEMLKETQSKDSIAMSQQSSSGLRGKTSKTKNRAEPVRTDPGQDRPKADDTAISAARIADKTEKYTLAHPHGPYLDPLDPLSQRPHSNSASGDALPMVLGEQPVAGYSVGPEPQREDMTWSKTLISLASCIDLAHTLFASLASGQSISGSDNEALSTNALSGILPKLVAGLLVKRDMMDTMLSIFGEGHEIALGEFVKHFQVVKQYLTAQVERKSISGNKERDRGLTGGSNDSVTHSFLEVTLHSFLSHLLGMEDGVTGRIVRVLVDLVREWREGSITGIHIAHTISLMRNELENIRKRHSTNVKEVEITRSKAHDVLHLLEQFFGLIQFDHPDAETAIPRAIHPASEVAHQEGRNAIPPATVSNEDAARSVGRHTKDDSVKRRHKSGLESFEGKVDELEHKFEDKFRGSSPHPVEEISSSTDPATLTIDVSLDTPVMPFHLKRETAHKEPKLPASKARDASTARPRHVRKAPAPPVAPLQKTPPPRLHLPPTTHAFLSGTIPQHDHEPIVPLHDRTHVHDHEPIESIITFPPGPAIGSHPALEGVHLERHRPSWSSDSHYSDEVESEGTVESDEEARELLANANSGPRMEMPVNKKEKEEEEEPSKEMVEEAKEILKSKPRKVKTKFVTEAKA